jgi:hypothetical protein
LSHAIIQRSGDRYVQDLKLGICGPSCPYYQHDILVVNEIDNMDDIGLASALEETDGDNTPIASSYDRRHDAADSDVSSPQKSSARSGGFGFATIREKASIQDRLIEK